MYSRVALLVILNLSIALSVVYLRHRERTLFAELQRLQSEYDSLNIEWGRLLLEEGAWAQHGRIEHTAEAKLGMSVPSVKDVNVVELSERKGEN